MVDGTEEQEVTPGAYAVVRRRWSAGDVVRFNLPMDTRLTAADDRVDAVRGCVAVERGPIVYAIEEVDQPDGVPLEDISVSADGPRDIEYRPDFLGGVVVVHLEGMVRAHTVVKWPYGAPRTAGTQPGDKVPIVAVPYFAWGNRSVGPMRVWLPRSDST
jgi:DUF1680 family protein